MGGASDMTPAEARSIREGLGLSHEDLARILSNSRSMVIKRESGEAPISFEVAHKLHDLINDWRRSLREARDGRPERVRVYGPGEDERSWDETGRPPRWHRQIAFAFYAETGSRIHYGEPPAGTVDKSAAIGADFLGQSHAGTGRCHYCGLPLSIAGRCEGCV